jgi:ATP-binding cassette subfamily G (WHITE) protein 2 (SNQ2)
MAATIMPIIILVFEFFNGVLQPQALMPAVWAYTFYYIAPFTYWISGIVAMILPRLEVACTDAEFIRFQAPPGSTCAAYAGDWLANTTGYLANPNATGDCGFCQYSSGEDVSRPLWLVVAESLGIILTLTAQYLSNLGITRSKAWPYLGLFAMFTVTNYLCVYGCVYIKSVKKWLPW